MNKATTKASLSLAQKHLLELMQEINFGHIEGLVIHNGEPSFKASSRIVREIRFGGENAPRPELKTGDFVLKAHVVDFFTHLKRLKNGTIENLEIKHGVPFRMNLEEKARF